MTVQKITLVIGASENPERYSNKAIQLLNQYNHPVLALGLRNGMVGPTTIVKDIDAFKSLPIDTVTLYINPQLQATHYTAIMDLKPKRVIFNPGTENLAFESLLNENGILTEEACTLVLLKTGQY
jgi:predicted CoA-binding protein